MTGASSVEHQSQPTQQQMHPSDIDIIVTIMILLHRLLRVDLMSTHAALLGKEEPTLTSLLARFVQMTEKPQNQNVSIERQGPMADLLTIM